MVIQAYKYKVKNKELSNYKPEQEMTERNEESFYFFFQRGEPSCINCHVWTIHTTCCLPSHQLYNQAATADGVPPNFRNIVLDKTHFYERVERLGDASGAGSYLWQSLPRTLLVVEAVTGRTDLACSVLTPSLYSIPHLPSPSLSLSVSQ